jgi:hypothetical protein
MQTGLRPWEPRDHRANPTQSRAAFKTYSTYVWDLFVFRHNCVLTFRTAPGPRSLLGPPPLLLGRSICSSSQFKFRAVQLISFSILALGPLLTRLETLGNVHKDVLPVVLVFLGIDTIIPVWIKHLPRLLS